MSRDEIEDPRVVPRWVEAGVSGVPRSREWDVVCVLELTPNLGEVPADELELIVLPDRTPVGPVELGRPLLERLEATVEHAVRPPYLLRVVRRERGECSVAARELYFETATFPGVADTELAVAVTPDGERTRLIGGEEPRLVSAEVERALAELERRGRARHRAFAARAERLAGDLWSVTVDPL